MKIRINHRHMMYNFYRAFTNKESFTKFFVEKLTDITNENPIIKAAFKEVIPSIKKLTDPAAFDSQQCNKIYSEKTNCYSSIMVKTQDYINKIYDKILTKMTADAGFDANKPYAIDEFYINQSFSLMPCLGITNKELDQYTYSFDTPGQWITQQPNNRGPIFVSDWSIDLEKYEKLFKERKISKDFSFVKDYDKKNDFTKYKTFVLHTIEINKSYSELKPLLKEYLKDSIGKAWNKVYTEMEGKFPKQVEKLSSDKLRDMYLQIAGNAYSPSKYYLKPENVVKDFDTFKDFATSDFIDLYSGNEILDTVFGTLTTGVFSIIEILSQTTYNTILGSTLIEFKKLDKYDPTSTLMNMFNMVNKPIIKLKELLFDEMQKRGVKKIEGPPEEHFEFHL